MKQHLSYKWEDISFIIVGFTYQKRAIRFLLVLYPQTSKFTIICLDGLFLSGEKNQTHKVLNLINNPLEYLQNIHKRQHLL